MAKMAKGILGGREVNVCLCPRCDGWPDFNRESDGDLWYWFSCPDCGFVPGIRMYGTGNEALQAWNEGAEREAEAIRRRTECNAVSDGTGKEERTETGNGAQHDAI